MHLLVATSPPTWLETAALTVVAACLVIWAAAVVRWWTGRPVIPYQPRRPVPWAGLHILLTVVVFFAVFFVASPVISHFLAGKAAQPEKAENPKTLHTVEQMLVASQWNPSVVILAVLAVVVVAPVVEEFFFRVLLQGWLETVARRHRRTAWLLWRALPGAAPILISSLVFGAIHFQRPPKELDPWKLIAAKLIADALAKLLAMAYIVMLLRAHRGATAADFGWDTKKLGRDAGLGLLAFLAIFPPLGLLLYFFQAILPGNVAAPLAIFFFALMLGTLYYRTHRVVPSIVTHAALNATTLLVLWLGQ